VRLTRRSPRRALAGFHCPGSMGSRRCSSTAHELSLLVLLALTVGCSSGSNSGAFSIGPHPPLPYVEDNGGGILTAPEIVTVTFDPSLYTYFDTTQNAWLAVPAAATLIPDLGTFDDGVTTTSWWQTVVADYCDPKAGCIGPGIAGAHVSIPDLPPGDGTPSCGPQPCYTDTAVGGAATLKTYISSLLNAGTLPMPNPQTLYVMYFPSSVTIDVDGSVSCQSIGGYHDSLSVGSLHVPYAIVPVCSPEPTANGVPALNFEQTATIAASHEIVEATTDPHGGETPAGATPSTQYLGYYLTDPESQAWAYFGGEVADLCVDLLGMGQDRWTEGNYVYQKVWSNTSAMASHDPCVPIPPGEVYFNAAPSTIQGQPLSVGVGATANLQVDAFSDAPAPSWQVFGIDVGTSSAGNQLNILLFAPGEKSPELANNDESIPFMVELTELPPLPADAPSGTAAVEPYFIISWAQGAAHLWPAFVVSAQ